MLNTIPQSRDYAIRSVMERVVRGDLDVNVALRFISALNEEYVVVTDSIKRWDRACNQLTDNRTVILGSG
jgi:hypothetical protein